MTGIDAKVELVRYNIPFYVAAGEVRLHPNRLMKFLNSTDPLPEKLAERLMKVIENERHREKE